MSYIQESIQSMMKEHSVRNHLTLFVSMSAVVLALAVFWLLHLNGITMTSEDPICGLPEHTHTTDCYGWVVSDTDTETEATEPENTEAENTETEATETTAAANSETTEATETDTDSEEESESSQPGDTRVVNGVTYVYALICELEEHTHTAACYESTETEEDTTTEAETVTEADNTAETYSMTGTEPEIKEAGNTLALFSAAPAASSTVLDARTSSEGTYYAADAVKLEDVDDTGSTNYVIYTEIDGAYYVLDAVGRLHQVNDTSGGDGTAISWGADDNLGFYQWSVTETDTDTYTVYNSSYDKYLVPSESKSSGTDDDVTIATGFSAHTGELTFSGDFELTYTFTNTCTDKGTTNNYYNYIIEMVGDGTYLDVRADNYGWIYTKDNIRVNPGETVTGTSDTIMVGTGLSDWTSWLQEMKQGTSVTVTVTRIGTSVTVTMTAAGSTFTATAYVSEYTDDVPVTVYITGEQCSITDVTYSYDGMTCSDGTDDDVTIGSTFLDGSTGTLSFSGDFVLDYAFTNTCSGSDNWENYVVEILNTGSTVLYMRADNYGWIDGAAASSIVFGDGASDWSDWLSKMQDREEVEVQIVRNGGTITATATAAGETFTMVAYVSDFENAALTVCLAGQTCTLSDVSYSCYEPSNSRTSETSGNTVIKLENGTSDAYSWTATDSNGTYTLYSQDTTGYIEWVDGSGNCLLVYDSEEATELTFRLAAVRSYTVFFDGTNGGCGMYAYGTQTTVTTTEMDSTCSYFLVTVPEAEIGNRYAFSLRGWYDIYNKIYWETGYDYDAEKSPITIQISYDSTDDTYSTVCYADWGVESYVFGESTDSNVVEEVVDTSGFITTTLYDYNDLMNLYSADIDSSTINSTTHKETWKVTGLGERSLLLTSGLNFVFMASTNSRGTIGLVNNREDYNTSASKVYTGIVTNEEKILDYLFGTTVDYADYDASTNMGVIGKTTVGNADGLFQFNSTAGYYYYDSSLNAAKYNEKNQCFYLYDYTVSVSSISSSTSDFLPFNTGSTGASWVNYWFGMKSEISFYLPQNTGSEINPTNQTRYTGYEDMVFRFMGDDDVWVFVDDVLVLDMGGIHGQMYGEIDFSTGVVRIVENPTATFTNVSGGTETVVSYDSNNIVGISENLTDAEKNTYVTEKNFSEISSGSHTLTFCYLERGGSESNAAILTNLASTSYNLTLSKVDESENSLSGAEFTFYTDSAFTEKAQLKTSAGDTASTFAASDTAYNLMEGVTYYVVETKSPDGYTSEGKYFTVLLEGDVLTVNVYDTTGAFLETYEYKITYDTSTKNTEVACTTAWQTPTASTTGTSSWQYVLLKDGSDNSLSVSAYISSANTVNYFTIGFKIANTSGKEIPNTGSTGTLPYRIAGETLVFISGTGLLIIAFYQFVRMRKSCTNANKKESTEDSPHRHSRCTRTRGHPRQWSITRGHARDRPDTRGAPLARETILSAQAVRPPARETLLSAQTMRSSVSGGAERSRGTGPG